MKKSKNEKGHLISYGIAVLLTVAFFGIFFMGADGIAQVDNIIIVCNNFQDYECNYIVYQYGQIDGGGSDCVELCYDGFEVFAYDSDFFAGLLYPATGSKNLLGTAYTGVGWAGFSMDFRGRSMSYRFSFVGDGSGYTETGKCTPCDDCCSSLVINSIITE
jgi:hypothetical protein